MKTIIFTAVVMAALTTFAQAGPRETCAASTGVKNGPAFNACMASASKAGTRRPAGSLGSGSAMRGACRQSGKC